MPVNRHALRPLARTALAMGGLLLAAAASAQVYRHVGPDGRVTYSDRAPAAAQATTSERRGATPPAPAPASDALPYALRQTVQRFPVTLYGGVDCAPCQSGRQLLTARGVPFIEKTVSSAADIDALKALSGDASLPLLTVGAQQLKGYSDAEWAQTLDAAGYPKASQLPRSYVRPAATPLAPPRPAAGALAPVAPAAVDAPATGAVPVTPQRNPGSIRF